MQVPLQMARRAAGLLCLDLGGGHEDSVFLAGSGRSGTSWASGLINHRNEYRYVFEPFYPDRVPLVSGFRSKQYLRPTDARSEFLVPARAVLSGRVHSPWTDGYNRKTIARRRLIKDIRANLMLGWMRAHFPEMPIVLLMRHPCAVVASRLRLGWRDNLDETMEQGDLIEDFLLPFEDAIRAAATPFERHLALWCMDNHVPLRQLAKGEVHVVFFETLLASPREELPRLFSYLGRTFDESLYDAMRPPGMRPESLISGWRAAVSERELRRALETLSLFGLDVYGEDPMPRPENLVMGAPS